MAKKPTILPPRPDLIRQPAGHFGWLEDRLLSEHWLTRLGPEATAAMVLLALAAERRGASFYGRERMANEIGMSRQNLDQALKRLLELRLVLHRPWRQGHPDGIWQLLPLPTSTQQPRGGDALAIGEVFKTLGLQPPKPRPHSG